ncbi:hypothetical protein KKI24_29190 [bacterium]|nr:hypothetical protein [bacterium]
MSNYSGHGKRSGFRQSRGLLNVVSAWLLERTTGGNGRGTAYLLSGKILKIRRFSQQYRFFPE